MRIFKYLSFFFFLDIKLAILKFLCFVLPWSQMSVGWDVKWCPVSSITAPFARRSLFLQILKKSKVVKATRETSTFHTISYPDSSCRDMAGILPIRQKKTKQSINPLSVGKKLKVLYYYFNFSEPSITKIIFKNYFLTLSKKRTAYKPKFFFALS